jgi:DnaJ-class molecular chaperone
MVDLTGNHDVKAICPRCNGNGFIKIVLTPASEEYDCHDCPQCECQGEVILPAKQCRLNVEGGVEARGKKSGECI